MTGQALTRQGQRSSQGLRRKLRPVALQKKCRHHSNHEWRRSQAMYNWGWTVDQCLLVGLQDLLLVLFSLQTFVVPTPWSPSRTDAYSSWGHREMRFAPCCRGRCQG